MQRITALWNRGLIGKLTISLIGLVVVCCGLGVVSNILNPGAAQQRAAERSQTATAQSAAQPAAAVQPTTEQATVAPEATAGPTNTPAPTATPEPTDTPEPPTATPEPTPAPEPIVIEGSGQTVTDPITPPAGVYRVIFTHDGRRNFIVQSFAGDDTDFLVNTIGTYEGSRPLIGGNEMFFEVDADGAWSIRVEPIAFDETVADGAEGSGDQITGLFTPAREGAVPYTFTHSGERNFIVQIHCAGGSDFVQNEIGAADNEAVVRFETAPCFWEVQADGDWAILPK